MLAVLTERNLVAKGQLLVLFERYFWKTKEAVSPKICACLYMKCAYNQIQISEILLIVQLTISIFIECQIA